MTRTTALATILLATSPSVFAMDEELKLQPELTEPGSVWFGSNCEIIEGLAYVSAINGAGISEHSAGSVYIYDMDETSETYGEELGRLRALDGTTFSKFSGAVDAQAGVAIVGAYREDGNGLRSGAAYLFDVDPESPTFTQQIAKFVPDNLSGHDSGNMIRFAEGVSIDNGIAYVGAVVRNEIYLFDAQPGSATFGDRISKLTLGSTPASNPIGQRLVVENGVILTYGESRSELIFVNGVPGTEGFGEIIGAYEDPHEIWSFDQSGGIAVIGLPGVPETDVSGSGSARIIDANPLLPTFTQPLATLHRGQHNPGVYDGYGTSVTIAHGVAAVTAPSYTHPVGTPPANHGCAYLFRANRFDPNTGIQTAHLMANEPTTQSFFGSSIALSQTKVLIGAQYEDTAYSFLNESAPCSAADLDGNGTLDFFDISIFLSTTPDWDPNTVFDYFDLSAYLADFNTGCP